MPHLLLSQFNFAEPPRVPDVYRVLVHLNGVLHPLPHEPALFSYYDGVDTWSTWEFSPEAAMRAKPHTKQFMPWCPVATDSKG